MAGMTNRTRLAGLTAKIVMAMACAAAGLSPAGDVSLDDAWLSARVPRLDDGDYKTREAATEEIASRNTPWIASIATELATAPKLSAEERALVLGQRAAAREGTSGESVADEAAWKARADAALATNPELSVQERKYLLKRRIEERNREWLGAIEGRLATDTELSPEQRERLLQVGTKLFDAIPHGAMGVQFSQIDRGEGVEISMVVKGFDAAHALSAGDTVLEIDGRPVNARDDMRSVIISHDPGDRLEMTLLRRGERVVVSLRLGDYSDLRSAAVTDRSLLRDALEERVARRAGKRGANHGIIDSGIDSGEWAKLQLGLGDGAARRGASSIVIRDDENSKVSDISAGGADRVSTGADPNFSANAVVTDQSRIDAMNQKRGELIELYKQLSVQIAREPNQARKVIIDNQRRSILVQLQDMDQKLRNAGAGGQPQPAPNRMRPGGVLRR